MHRPMPYLTFADLIRDRVPMAPSEAVALTLAVARALDARRGDAPGVQPPNAASLLLSSTGDVTFGGVERATEDEEIAALSSLLRWLLQLDEPGHVDRRGRVPGGLLVLLARALRQIDLALPTRQQFLTALIRFAGPSADDRTALAAIFWRAAAMRPGIDAGRKPFALLPPPPAPVLEERRSAGPSRSELRRALRELEREVFEHAAAPVIVPAPVATRVPTPARPTRRLQEQRAGVAVALVCALFVLLVGGGASLQHLRGETASAAAPANRTPTAPRSAAVPPAVRTAPRPAAAPAMAASNPALPAPAASAIRFTATSSPRSVAILTRAQVGRDAFSPSFDPRGRAIYFHAGRDAASLMRADVEADGAIAGVTKVLDDGASNYHVTVAPNGRMIAFDSDRDGARGVYIADINGRGARRISGSGYAAIPSWSPDGAHVAFIRAEPGKAKVWNVWTTDIAGGAMRRITQYSVGQPWGASWFPDGRRLALSHEQELVIVDLVTGRRTLISSPRPGHIVRTPAVSPDGSRVVFQVYHDGAWMLDMREMMLRRILPDPSAEEFVWAPNGRTLAYHAHSNAGWGVWKVDL